MHSSWWFPFMDLHIFTENHYIDDLPYWGEVIPHSAKPPHTAHEPTAARINRQKTNSWRMCLSSSAAIAPAQDPFMRVRQRAGRKVSMWEVFNDTLPNWAVKRCLTKIESDIQYQVPWKLKPRSISDNCAERTPSTDIWRRTSLDCPPPDRSCWYHPQAL